MAESPPTVDDETFDGADAVARLAADLAATAPLAGALETVPRVAPLGGNRVDGEAGDGFDALERLLTRLARELGLPPLRLVPEPQGLTAPELAISGRLALGALLEQEAGVVDTDDDHLSRAAARVARPCPRLAHSRDGSPIHCYEAGPTDAPAVVLVTACGMPVSLVRRWMAELGDRFRVLTWESRGLFAPDPGFDLRGHDVAAQAEDLYAVLDTFGVEAAHVMGLCGGAAVALAAAPSPRVRSLSLWHGDYELGDEAPKTEHQQDVQSLMVMAGERRERAANLHKILRRPNTLDKLRADMAHELIYPYATAELLHRYGRLNGAIMTTDCRPLLAGVHQPTLVVTSDADTTAHPAGSALVAERIPGARLRTPARGDHLSAFDAAPAAIALARAFMDEVGFEGGM
ncbi:alpha/beta fold hydrolase [Salinactinospora qingdaonensis]|uniref:Pimeloyl-ACP methyl ester carboxylesterase n=1 Tax=Salinactinospora qingdaonensis TaxID=702744 RepID=A0ABP7GAP4_9ACTN